MPFKFPEPLSTPTHLGDILFKKVDEKYTISDKLYEGHLRRKEMHKQKEMDLDSLYSMKIVSILIR